MVDPFIVTGDEYGEGVGHLQTEQFVLQHAEFAGATLWRAGQHPGLMCIGLKLDPLPRIAE